MLLAPYNERVAAGTMPDPWPETIKGHKVERVEAHDHMYDLFAGIYYQPGTPGPVLRILHDWRNHRGRLRLHYGDTDTGRDWMDEWDMEGYLSNSTGPIRIPILVNNDRSMGGGSVLSACVVRIRHANRNVGGDLYRHPNYHVVMDEFRRNIPEAQQARIWKRHFA